MASLTCPFCNPMKNIMSCFMDKNIYEILEYPFCCGRLCIFYDIAAIVDFCASDELSVADIFIESLLLINTYFSFWLWILFCYTNKTDIKENNLDQGWSNIQIYSNNYLLNIIYLNMNMVVLVNNYIWVFILFVMNMFEWSNIQNFIYLIICLADKNGVPWF